MTLGPVDGTIVSIKDLFDVAGEPTTAGSLMLKTAAPPCAMRSSCAGCGRPAQSSSARPI
jgi:hypothetical protein